MNDLAQQLKAYIEAHPFDPGDSDRETVLDQLYQAYAEFHESDPPEFTEGPKELELPKRPPGGSDYAWMICVG